MPGHEHENEVRREIVPTDLEQPRKEVEPKRRVVLVYRGENPLMRWIADSLQKVGYEVDQRQIPKDTPSVVDNDPSEFVKLTGELNGTVISDNSLRPYVSKLIGHEPLSAYETLGWEVREVNDVVNKLKPIVDEIRGKGQTPVALRNALGDHFSLYLPDKETEKLDDLFRQQTPDLVAENRNEKYPSGKTKAANRYSMILQENLNVPIIPRTDFAWRYTIGEPTGNIESALGQLGISKDKAVLLVDHHIYDIREHELKESGLDDVYIVAVCPCCIGIEPRYDLTGSGFKMFPLEYSAQRQEIIHKLEEKIAKAVT